MNASPYRNGRRVVASVARRTRAVRVVKLASAVTILVLLEVAVLFRLAGA